MHIKVKEQGTDQTSLYYTTECNLALRSAFGAISNEQACFGVTYTMMFASTQYFCWRENFAEHQGSCTETHWVELGTISKKFFASHTRISLCVVRENISKRFHDSCADTGSFSTVGFCPSEYWTAHSTVRFCSECVNPRSHSNKIFFFVWNHILTDWRPNCLCGYPTVKVGVGPSEASWRQSCQGRSIYTLWHFFAGCRWSNNFGWLTIQKDFPLNFLLIPFGKKLLNKTVLSWMALSDVNWHNSRAEWQKSIRLGWATSCTVHCKEKAYPKIQAQTFWHGFQKDFSSWLIMWSMKSSSMCGE